MKYSAIDLHSNNSVVVVTDEQDRVLAQKRLPNDLSVIVAFLAPHQSELVGVVVESTYNWYWLVDGLMAAGFAVKLANTAAVRTYDGLKHSGDEADARHLAQMLRLNILPTGYICPQATFAHRRSVRYATWRAVDCNWCAIAPCTFWPSRTKLHGRPGTVFAATTLSD